MNARILIVEDDPSALRLLEYTLSSQGYSVTTASDGLEGLHKIKEEHPELILLDVMLPGLDGYEVCRRLREAEATRGATRVPVIMLSAKARQDDRSTGFKVGASEYLSKPVDPDIVLGRVKALLETPPAMKVTDRVGPEQGLVR